MAHNLSYAVGSECHWAKLNEDKVIEIRRRHAGGESRQKLAEEFGVSRRTIWSVTEWETWRWMDGQPRHEPKPRGLMPRRRRRSERVQRQVFTK